MSEMPPVELLFRDDHLVVVNKPAGLVVHRGWAREKVVVMTQVRDALGQHVFPVHRLDRQTSGVLCFALSPESARALRTEFDEHRVEKRYLALVRGCMPEPGVIDYPIPRSESGPRVPATTEYRPLWLSERYTLMEARPRTGRLHQIRRHFKHLDHPIVWDKKYGRGRFNEIAAELYGFGRMVLHARSLEVVHPETGERMRFQAPVVDLAGPLRAMGIPEELWG